MYEASEQKNSFPPRTIGRVVLAIIVTACVAPQVFNFFSTNAKNDATHAQRGVNNFVLGIPNKRRCNFVQESQFHPPYAVPSCTWVSSSASTFYECDKDGNVKKTEYDAPGCKFGGGTQGAETILVNGQNGAIVDCSNARTCFARSAIAKAQCPIRQRPAIGAVAANEEFALGVCFGVFFEPKRTRYGCDDNELVTDRFEEDGCTGVFYRTEAPSCAAISSSSAQVHRCSFGAPKPAKFPEPSIERESCGGSDNPSVTVQQGQCYATSFPSPAMFRCERRYGRKIHVETLFDGNDCSGTVVAELSMPANVCLNGVKDECEGSVSAGGSAIPNSEAIVGKYYSSAACTGAGIGFRVRKNTEFNVGFKKVKFVCSAGGVEEQENGNTLGTLAIGNCAKRTGNLGMGGLGVVGEYVKFDQCPQ